MTSRMIEMTGGRIVRIAVAAVSTLLMLATPTVATNTIAEVEGIGCTTCHDKPGSKLYTDRGKYYEATGSLEGYDQIIEAFQSCTTCHVRKPGSQKLTRRGKNYAMIAEDMDDIREWLEAMHRPAEEPADDESESSDATESTEESAVETESGGGEPLVPLWSIDSSVLPTTLRSRTEHSQDR